MRRGEWITHLATAGWSLGVAALLLVPGDAQPSQIPWPEHIDKALHAFLFAGQTFLMARSARVLGLRRPRLTAAVVALILALTLENAQRWVPRRHVETADFVANLVGIACGVLPNPRREDAPPSSDA